ncbi:MAG: hypothetical protein FWD59_09175 [Micrococcales bacterium]|nr:hypothetical protein [Micrococcales bacterium]
MTMKMLLDQFNPAPQAPGAALSNRAERELKALLGTLRAQDAEATPVLRPTPTPATPTEIPHTPPPPRRRYQRPLMVLATIAAAAALIVVGSHIAPEPQKPRPAEPSPSVSPEDFIKDEEARRWDRLRESLTVTVIDVTQSADSWGTSFTLEMPHPLRDDLTVLMRAWLSVPHSIPWGPGEEIGLSAKDRYNFHSSGPGEPRLTIGWEGGKSRGLIGDSTTAPCIYAGENTDSSLLSTEACDAFVTPSVWGLTFADEESSYLEYGETDVFAGPDESGLYIAAETPHPTEFPSGVDLSGFSVQVVTENPDAIRESLTGLTLTPDGIWAFPPTAPFGDALPPGPTLDFPKQIVANVIDSTQSDAEWGNSFTLEMPHPLRDDLTVLMRIWPRSSDIPTLESGQAVHFAKGGVGDSSYTFVDDPLLVLRWDRTAVRTTADERASEPCALADDRRFSVLWSVRDLDACVTPSLSDTSYWDNWPVHGHDPSGLIIATTADNYRWIRPLEERSFVAYSLQVVTENPDSIRETLTSLAVTPDGAWTLPPSAPFANLEHPTGFHVLLPGTITAEVVDVSRSDSPWGESFTLEMPHPLRDDLTVVTRTWLEAPQELPLEPNRKIELVEDDKNWYYPYTLAGASEFKFNWSYFDFPPTRDEGSDDPCGDGTMGTGKWSRIERYACVALNVEHYSNLEDAADNICRYAVREPFEGRDASGLVGALTELHGLNCTRGKSIFTLQVITENPDLVHTALADLALTPDGAWSSPPKPPLDNAPYPSWGGGTWGMGNEEDPATSH